MKVYRVYDPELRMSSPSPHAVLEMVSAECFYACTEKLGTERMSPWILLIPDPRLSPPVPV